MKTTKCFFMAALALMTAACSNSDNDILTPAEQPAKAQGIPFTATISIGESASTRALAEDGSGGLTATWAAGDKVALIHNGVNDEMEVESVSGGVATITGTITSATAGADVTVIYPATAADGATGNVKANLLFDQSGATLDDVASKYDVRKGTGKLQVSGDPSVASLKGNVALTNENAIWKLTLDQSASDLYITTKGALLARVTRATAGKEFYVAVPAVASKTVSVIATDETFFWYFSKPSVSLAAGKYYQSNVTMNEVSTSSDEDVYEILGTSSTTIPDGKTAVLRGITIYGSIICAGDANIILQSDNTITANSESQTAIQIGGTGTTLTIMGTGSLTAKGGNYAAGIGTGDALTEGTIGGAITINGGTVTATGGESGAGIGTGDAYNGNNSCGAITINGGTVTATGGNKAAGIGTGNASNAANAYINACSNITINGGTVIATGGSGGAGIGTGYSMMNGSNNTHGNITIGTGVTSVKATKGSDSPNSIGKGSTFTSGGGTPTCGTITIGGDATTYAAGVTDSPFTYPTAP